MDAFAQYLLDYGYLGMFIAAFLAGTIVPFASEAVLIALIKMGLEPYLTTLCATAGNAAGSMTCYWIGHLGNMQWIEKYLKVKPSTMQRAERFVKGRGAWMGFFSFLPIVGDAITIVLGLMRATIWITITAVTIGKLIRYTTCILATEGLISLFYTIWK